jgi:hypothetical protein
MDTGIIGQLFLGVNRKKGARHKAQGRREKDKSPPSFALQASADRGSTFTVHGSRLKRYWE